MVRDVPALIEFLSQSTTLLPGTAIFTGTPHGVGMAQNPPLWLKDGGEVSIEIEKIGTLTNTVRQL
jgi:2-keto-4-pentenoate hydratase/2-oxohepta-3-ene-1,7-dioic acid hydratase in catechol pathway